MALIFITLGTFFLIGFHFRMSTFLLLMVFATKMAYAKFVAQKWIDSEVLYTTAYCAIMLSCLFAGPGTFCADKHK
jgi:uncharacterized membrane protein YphA (DoxX/SURF4 family)